MRVLHVGWGFSPWRPGGLIAYAEDLMAAQVERGHDVAYFFSGRFYPYISGPRLKRWRRLGVAMHEVVNPPIVPGLEHGTHRPDLDLSEPRIEAAFRRLLASFRPDVVHVQELHGLPSSLLDIAREAGAPTVMTLHDYGPLCATLRLFDADGRICIRRQVGADCVARNSDAPLNAGVYVDITLRYEAGRALQALGLGGTGWSLVENRVVKRLRSHAMRSTWDMPPEAKARLLARPEERAARGSAFQRRRELNVARLGRIEGLIAQSPRVAEVYCQLGVSGERMRVMPAPARHIERLRPRRLERAPATLTFATINGCASPTKGSETVVGALRALRARGLEGAFRLRVLGFVHPDVRSFLRGYDGVEVGGVYDRSQLDALLDEVDVGIVPSMWEEAYGYTGLEMIAKGIPLIANPLGGIVQYAHEGRTAWHNRSCSPDGLAGLIEQLVREPGDVVAMHRRVVQARGEVVPRWDDHVDALGSVYREVAGAAGPGPRAAAP